MYFSYELISSREVSERFQRDSMEFQVRFRRFQMHSMGILAEFQLVLESFRGFSRGLLLIVMSIMSSHGGASKGEVESILGGSRRTFRLVLRNGRMCF